MSLHVQVESVRLLDDNGETVLSQIAIPVTPSDRRFIKRLVRTHGPIEKPQRKKEENVSETNGNDR